MALSADAARTGATTSRMLNRLAFDIANIANANSTVASGDVIPTFDASADYEMKYSTPAQIALQMGGGTAGTVVASAAVVVDSNKDISAFRNVTVTNLDAGASGTAGTVDVFPSTASKGKLQIAVTDQTGDTTVTMQIGAMAAARTITLRDPGAAASLLTTTDATAAAVTATAAEISARCAAASRLVNVTDAATYSVLAADSGKVHIMPNFTASCTLTLPTAAAGLEYKFIGKAVADDAQNWIIKSPSATNYFIGGVSFADTDAGAGADEIHAGVWSNGSTNDFLTVVTPGAGTYIYVICDGTNWIVNGQVFSATVPAFSDT